MASCQMDSFQTVHRVHDERTTVQSIFRQVFICSTVWVQFFVAGLCFGLPTVMIPQLRKDKSYYINDELSSWIYAIPFSCGIPFVALPYFSERVGRKIPQIIASIDCVFVFGCLCLASSTYFIILAELFEGFFHGCNVSIGILILSEYSSPKYRGMFLTMSTAAFFWGIWIADLIGAFFAWRNIAIVGLVCSLYMLTVFLWPESPIWLASKKRYEESKEAFRWIHGYTAEEELQTLCNENGAENFTAQMKLYKILQCPEFYKPMMLSIVAVLQYQFSGKMIYSLYILDIFKATAPERVAYTAMLVLNGVSVLSMYFGSYLTTLLKRRTLYMTTSLIAICFLFIISIYLFLCKLNVLDHNNYLLICFLVLYNISISSGPMILSGTICGELISVKFQTISYVILFITIASCLGILSKLTLKVFGTLGIHGSFCMYGVICSLCTLYLYRFLPETKNKTKWEIEEMFNEKNNNDID